MDHTNARVVPGPFLRHFLIGDHLPFTPLLDIDPLTTVVERHLGRTRDRISTPLVTLAMFLRRVVEPDHSCRAAVEHLAAARAAAGLPPGSGDTGGYCKARHRLTEALIRDFATRAGGALQGGVDPGRLFHGRPVKIVDGTGYSMPDSADNRHGVDFRQGRRLGPDDHVVDWAEPARPDWLEPAAYDALPAAMAVREPRVWVTRAGFRTRVVLIATTLLDPAAFHKAEVAGLWRSRWRVELDIRSLK